MLMYCINHENIDLNITLMNAFKDKKSLEKILNYLKDCDNDGAKFLKKLKEPTEVQIKLNFNHKQNFDLNQNQMSINSEPLIYSSKILFRGKKYVFDEKIGFEVDKAINPLNNNFEIKFKLLDKN